MTWNARRAARLPSLIAAGGLLLVPEGAADTASGANCATKQPLAPAGDRIIPLCPRRAAFVQSPAVDRDRLFWTLNIAGWAGYLIAAWLGALAHEKPESYFWVLAATAASGLVATLPLRAIYRRFWSRSVWQLGLAMLASSYVLAFGWRWLQNKLFYDWVKDAWQPEHLMDYVAGVLGSFYLLLCWSGLYVGIKYYQQLQEQTQATLKATAAAHQAQLKMLRYQLNPHFLFNTLNAISTGSARGSVWAKRAPRTRPCFGPNDSSFKETQGSTNSFRSSSRQTANGCARSSAT
jgi:hypothetical protein